MASPPEHILHEAEVDSSAFSRCRTMVNQKETLAKPKPPQA
jgi:hypothetical protein